jgi:trehalose 6-phosphate phosphatase
MEEDGRSAPQKRDTADLPNALEQLDEIARSLQGREPAVFLDYDGTLTPIVRRPEDAVLSEEMRHTVRRLAEHCTVALISGRDLDDVRGLVGLAGVFYAGSHGFDIAGPQGDSLENRKGNEFLPVLDRAQHMLQGQLAEIPGARLERKRFSIAVHYREVEEARVKEVEQAVDRVAGRFSGLRRSGGKKIFELQPGIDWDKGKAVLWLLDALEIDGAAALPLYIGDDITDEDAFRALQGRGIGIVVEEGSKETAAQYVLQNPAEVQAFLQQLTTVLKKDRA